MYFEKTWLCILVLVNATLRETSSKQRWTQVTFGKPPTNNLKVAAKPCAPRVGDEALSSKGCGKLSHRRVLWELSRS